MLILYQYSTGNQQIPIMSTSKFSCPICFCGKYDTIQNGGQPQYFVCCYCSVHFSNPARFGEPRLTEKDLNVPALIFIEKSLQTKYGEKWRKQGGNSIRLLNVVKAYIFKKGGDASTYTTKQFVCATESELLGCMNMGNKTLTTLKEILRENGLGLGMSFDRFI